MGGAGGPAVSHASSALISEAEFFLDLGKARMVWRLLDGRRTAHGATVTSRVNSPAREGICAGARSGGWW
jgi:hypothetical protein